MILLLSHRLDIAKEGARLKQTSESNIQSARGTIGRKSIARWDSAAVQDSLAPGRVRRKVTREEEPPVVTKEVLVQERKRLCRALQGEDKARVMLLRRAEERSRGRRTKSHSDWKVAMSESKSV